MEKVLMYQKSIAFVVTIDFSQTDQTNVLVWGCDTMEEAIELVKSTTNCPRVYRNTYIHSQQIKQKK